MTKPSKHNLKHTTATQPGMFGVKGEAASPSEPPPQQEVTTVDLCQVLSSDGRVRIPAALEVLEGSDVRSHSNTRTS